MDLTTIAIVLACGAALFVSFRKQAPPRVTRDDLERWRKVAEHCELQDIEVLTSGTRGVRASLGELQVSFENGMRYGMAPANVVTVRGLARTIAFRTEGAGTRAGRALGGDDVTIGDPELDRTLYAEGPERILRALLDWETRRRLLDAFGGRLVARGFLRPIAIRVSIGEGALRADFPADVLDAGEEPRPATLECLLDLARRLQEPADVAVRLAENARNDIRPGVRIACLRTLHREDPRTARAALEAAARSDEDAEIRLEAAVLLGDDGRTLVEELAASSSVDDAASARALDHLVPHVRPELARRILEESRVTRRVATASAAARALGAAGSPADEAALLGALQDEDHALRTAAAEALAVVGTTDAVLALKTLEARSSDRLQKAAREAVARIQERQVGARPGQLALATDAAGQVTLAPDERGRVALPDERDPA